MSGIINQIGAKSGIITASSTTATGTVTLSGTTGLDYEEGTWTPQCPAGTAMAGHAQGNYTKIGRLVTIKIDATNNSGSAQSDIANLPFTSVNIKGQPGYIGYTDDSGFGDAGAHLYQAATNFSIGYTKAGAGITLGAGKRLIMSMDYFAAK